jgi:hypothetical protein
MCGLLDCAGTFEGHGAGALDRVQFHFEWGPSTDPDHLFLYSGFAIDTRR